MIVRPNLAERQCETVAPLSRVESALDDRQKCRVLVSEMAHVRVINVPPNEPAHGAARDNIGRKMLLSGNARRTHDSSQAVSSYRHNFFVFVFVIEQRRDRPDLDCMAGRESSSAGPEIARTLFVG